MFTLKFFWRDFKADYSYNLLFILCASLGIAGLLLVESFKVGIEDKISLNAKNLIASDLSISSRRQFNENEREKIKKYFDEKKIPYTEWIETYSVISHVPSSTGNQNDYLSKLADLNFVGREFPFYGKVDLEAAGREKRGDWKKIHETPSLWMSKDLVWELNLKIGDQVKIGKAIFTLEGIILQDQFSSFRGFNLAPKVFLSLDFLEKTELIKFGSTATYTYIAKIPDEKKAKLIQKELRNLIKDLSVKILTPRESNEQVMRSLNLLTDYLSLITLLTYLLSLVALYYFTQHFLSKKMKLFSIYKAMGVGPRFLFRVSFFHLVFLTFLTIGISGGGIIFILPLLESFFSRLAGEELFFRLSMGAILKIFALSFGGSLLALGPLLWGALQTSIAQIFQDLPMELKRIKYYFFIPLLIYVGILAIFLANSFKIGLFFIGGLLGIIIFSLLLFKFSINILSKFLSRVSFVNRHGLLTLSRYFASSYTIFICLLVGATLTTFIFQLQNSLRKEFSENTERRRPDLFIFDLQDSQADKFSLATKNEGWERTMFSPMIRGRLVRINGELTQKKHDEINDSSFQTREDENAQRIKNRGVNLSYRPELSWSETLISGKFSKERCHVEVKPCEISLEESYAKRLGVKIGDRLTFDVSGIDVEGVISSLRTVKWTSFEPNFFILFQEGILEDAPKTYLSTLKVKSFEEKKKIFTKIAKDFPGVSLVDVSEVIKKISKVFDLMTLAVKFISLLSFLVTLIVLISVSFNHLDLRKKDMDLFYTLGVRHYIIQKIYNREFQILIIFCLLFSVGSGTLLTTVVMRNIFYSESVFSFKIVFALMAAIGGILSLIVHFKIRQLMKNKTHF